MKDTKYSFGVPELQEYAKTFTKELKAKDEQLKSGVPVQRVAPLDKLGPSIDY